MTSPRVTSPEKKEGADRDGAEREVEAAESDCLARSYASLRFTVTASMTHLTENCSEKGKRIEKWHRIRVIAEGKMSLSWVAVSLYTSKIERITGEEKSIVRCSNKASKNQA